MKPDDAKNEVFTTGTRISDSPSWFSLLLSEYRERREEKKNPPPAAQITAAKDPSALEKLVETSSPLMSLTSSLRSLIQDTLHPRTIETTASPVEVEELWSEQKRAAKVLLSFGLHVGVVVLAIIPWATSAKPPQVTETAVMLYTPTPPVILPLMNDKSGGGGGGGMKTPTPPSLGKLPRGADKQIVPPTPEVKNMQPELIAEPTIVAPQLANLPQVSILQLGDPEGIPGPPSAGPGSGGGIGTGTGRGVGSGSGPGAGPGTGGGTGGGVFRPGGGVSAPEVISKVDPQYSEEARKARF